MLSGWEITGLTGGILAVIFGIIILIRPKLLVWLVGMFLLIVGVLAIVTALG